MAQKPKFNEEQTQTMVDMFKDGMAIKAIAREMNTSPITVKNYLKKAGVSKRPAKKGSAKKGRAKVARKAAVQKAPVQKTDEVGSLAELVVQLKQTENDIADLQKCLAQAVAKQAQQLEMLKQMVKI